MYLIWTKHVKLYSLNISRKVCFTALENTEHIAFLDVYTFVFWLWDDTRSRQCKAFIIKTTSSFIYSFTEYLHVKVSLSLKKNNPKWQNHCYRLLKHTFHSRIILHMFVHAHIHIFFFRKPMDSHPLHREDTLKE